MKRALEQAAVPALPPGLTGRVRAGPAAPGVTAVLQPHSRAGTAQQSSCLKLQVCGELKQRPRALSLSPQTSSHGDSPTGNLGAPVLTMARLWCLHGPQFHDQVGDTCFNIHSSRSEQSRFGAFQAFPVPSSHMRLSTGSEHRHGNPVLSWAVQRDRSKGANSSGEGMDPTYEDPPIFAG